MAEKKNFFSMCATFLQKLIAIENFGFVVSDFIQPKAHCKYVYNNIDCIGH